MRRGFSLCRCIWAMLGCALALSGAIHPVQAGENAPNRVITGTVQNQDLRRVDQAIVQVRDQEGNVVIQEVTNQAGEFTVLVPAEGTYSISAVQDTYKMDGVIYQNIV